MVNPYRGEVTFDLSGRTVTLAMTWGKVAELGDLLGGEAWDDELSTVLAEAALGKRPALTKLAEVLVLLAREDLTPDEVMTRSPALAEVSRALKACSSRFFYGAEPEPDDAPLGTAPSQKNGPGATELRKLLGWLRRTESRPATSGP